MAFWAVARCAPCREHTAQHFLELAGYEIYLPRFARQQVNAGRKIERLVPLFTSYLFVRITLQWHVINSTVGVIRLIMDGERPAQLHDRIIEEIRGRERNGVVQLMKPPRWRQGDRVVIAKGAFAGHAGLFQSMERDRVKVLMGLLGGQVPVTLGVGDLAPSTLK